MLIPKVLKSPLNYIGGKYKILNQLLPLFPKNIDSFIDLFCGGCNVSINIKANSIICNDNLIFLIELYRFLQNNTLDSILQEINIIIQKYELSLGNIQGYQLLRHDYNIHKNPIFLFVLVAYSFNHQLRFNNAHAFNTPFGKNRSSFNSNMKQNLISFIHILQTKNIYFYSLDFRDALETLSFKPNTFIYADPPYLITQGTYNDGKRGFSGWNENLESCLLQALEKLDSMGVLFALSNVLTHKNKENLILKEWLQKNRYFVYPIISNYTNANYQAKHKNKEQTKEILVTNYKAC